MKLINNIFSGKVLGIHRDMNLSLLNLKFRDEKEKEFKDYYFDYSIDFLRISLLFSIVFYMFFYLMDIMIFPKYKIEFLVIRLIVCLPISFAVFIISYKPFFRKIWQSLMFIMIQFSGLGIIYMILFSETTLQHFYFIGLILILMYNYMFSKIKFIWSAISGWSIFLLYVILVNLKLDIPFSENYMNIFFFASANIFGMLASYLVEYYWRREFYTISLLYIEKTKVENLNENLEEIVLSRTTELQETNKKLSARNRELHFSESELNKHKKELEILIKDRTKELGNKYLELEEKNAELERMNKLFVGREFRIKELKEKIKTLKSN